MDILGVQSIVTESHESDPLKDDDLRDKHPEYDPARVVIEEFDGCRVTLNKSASVTRLSIGPLEGPDSGFRGRVFPTRRDALEALGERPVLPSMEVVNGGLKPFNDGLYAAAELAAESGANGALIDKRTLFRDLLAELVTRSSSGAAEERPHAEAAAHHVAAAILLGGEAPDAPTAVTDAASSLADDFRENSLFAKPIGFYTWMPELEAIFTRDRWLQQRHLDGIPAVSPSFGALAETALVLREKPDLAARYRGVLGLYTGLTDPSYDATPFELGEHVPSSEALGDVEGIERAFFAANPPSYPDYPFCNEGIAMFPASESADNRIMRELLCTGAVSPGESLLDALIRAIQTGELDLSPRADSGWYDYQIHALETLLVPDKAPESQHLLLTREYKEKLVETFKSLLIQTRETHVKQISIVDARAASAEPEIRLFDIYPKLVVEPFPTFYLRTARAYRFVEGVLRAGLGSAFVDGTARLLEDGSRHDVVLGDELRDKALLLYGLHVVAADSIGGDYQLTGDETLEFPVATARARALAWLAAFRDDMDVNRDPRVSLPVALETGENGRDYAVYWAVVGVKVLRVHASFPKTHRPEIVEVTANDSNGFVVCEFRDWLEHEPYLLVEQTMEARRPAEAPPLTRDEFRALCDRFDDVDDIRRAFESEP